jgi:hypothetical protein
VVRVVVEDDEPLGARLQAQAQALLPGRVAPGLVAGVFLVGVHRVVDHEVGAGDEPEHVAVGLARHVLGVGEVAQRLAGELDAVAGGAVGMVERRGLHLDARRRTQRLAAREVAVLELGVEDLRWHREERRHHELGQHALQRQPVAKVSGPEAKAVALREEGPEEGQAADMVEMRVREEEVGVERLAFEGLAEVADAGASVEEQQPLAAAHFERRGIAAVARRARPGAGNGAAHAPEAHAESRRGHASNYSGKTPQEL